MLIIFGTRTVHRDVRNSVPERAHCARCEFISDLRHQSLRRYITMFFLPVIPISKAEYVLTCNRCGASYYGIPGAFQPGRGDDADPTKTVLVCPACTGKMRIPLKLEKAIRVTCPHCRDQFTVSVNRS